MNRTLCISSLLLALSWHAQAEPSQLQQAIQKCQQEQDSLLRLRCFDALEATNEAADDKPAPAQSRDKATPRVVPSTPATPAARTTPPGQSASPTRTDDDFGKSQPQQQQQDRIYATVTLIEQQAHGHLVITFDNGHIWRQVNSEHYPIQEGETHYIRRAVLGSFLMGSDRNNRTTRVRRVE